MKENDMKFRKMLPFAVAIWVFVAVFGLVTIGSAATQISLPVNVTNTPAHPIPTVVQSLPQRTLVHDGQSFVLSPDPNIAFEFAVPANVVLTDVVLSLTAPAQAVTIFVGRGDGNKTYVFQSVGSANSTFAGSNEGRATIHFQSGLQEPLGLRVGLYCNNIGGNVCEGAFMWSGYQP
jgi:hypothetical protein